MSTSAVSKFRQFANGLRKPVPYFPVTTELRGILNIANGSLQLVASVYMKYSSSSYYNTLEKRHAEIGSEALYVGLQQIAPAALVYVGYCYLSN